MKEREGRNGNVRNGRGGCRISPVLPTCMGVTQSLTRYPSSYGAYPFCQMRPTRFHYQSASSSQFIPLRTCAMGCFMLYADTSWRVACSDVARGRRDKKSGKKGKEGKGNGRNDTKEKEKEDNKGKERDGKERPYIPGPCLGYELRAIPTPLAT